MTEAKKGRNLKRDADDANLDISDDEEPRDSDNEHYYDEDNAVGSENDEVDNCDQLRRRIEHYLRRYKSGNEPLLKHFIEELGVSTTAYRNFMKQHGADKGKNSETYKKGLEFFSQRRGQLPKTPKVAALKAHMGRVRAAREARADTIAAFANIELDGEAEDAVEIYDSCDEIRRKIRAHLGKPGVTQPQFLRDLRAQFHGPRRPTTLSNMQLNNFRDQEGPVTGNTSGIYYAAYVFFEKERLYMGRGKTEHRLDMEDAWGFEGGVDVKTILHKVSYIVRAGSEIYMDSLGKVRSY